MRAKGVPKAYGPEGVVCPFGGCSAEGVRLYTSGTKPILVTWCSAGHLTTNGWRLGRLETRLVEDFNLYDPSDMTEEREDG